ncbi:MAG TPA: hypothetical protein DCX17_03140 [Firmicutes bacterium]|jgi:hypothetical protein|nr:hypothetical protein [Bacillota bacterium]
MAKYDVEFKKKCIKASEEGKPLPNVRSVVLNSMVWFTTEQRLLLNEQGEKGLSNDIFDRILDVTFKSMIILNCINAK